MAGALNVAEADGENDRVNEKSKVPRPQPFTGSRLPSIHGLKVVFAEGLNYRRVAISFCGNPRL